MEDAPERRWTIEDATARSVLAYDAPARPDSGFPEMTEWIRADLATPRVKPLAWKKKWSESWAAEIWQTDHPWLHRTIVPSNTLDGGWHLLVSRVSDIKGDYDTPDAAMEAVQSDYERRILEALE